MANPVRLEYPSQVRRVEPMWMKKASVAGSKGDWLTIVAGYALRAITTTPFVIGILGATWTNDATNSPVSVETDELGIYKMDVTGTLVQATHVGNAYDFTDHVTLNLSGTTYKPLVVVGVMPDGTALVRINKHLSSGSL